MGINPKTRANLRSYFSEQHWRASLANATVPAGGCSGAFVALISGSRYVTAALCLYRSLVAVGSTCPFVLVHDDRPAMRLRGDDMRILTRAISKESLVPITSLFSQLPNRTHRVRHNFSTWEKYDFAQPQRLPRPRPVTIGRRLYVRRGGTIDELYVTHLKLWLFALPFPRIVVLDLDMIIATNIDFLMHYEFSKRLAAVWACEDYFNSGLMILKPSKQELIKLLELGKHAAHLRRACEVKPGDQSILNAHHRHGRWHKLPTSLVTKWKGKANDTWRMRDPAVLHFASEPKPWDAAASEGTKTVWRELGCSSEADLDRLRSEATSS